MQNEVAIRRAIGAILAEYEGKNNNILAALSSFNKAASDLKEASTVGGTWGEITLDTGRVYEDTLKRSLLTSAWLHMYNILKIDYLATATDKKRFRTSIAAPPEFTLDNIVATFGHYLEKPRYHILRGLAEAFISLDPVYKSHEKVKIGVQGLPKRIILSSVGSWGSWGVERLRDAVNALCAVKGLPLTDYTETRDDDGKVLIYGQQELLKDGDYMRESHGIWLKRYSNGNGHLFFSPSTLREINLALAEFYGDVLPDGVEAGASPKPRESTEVAKDLQYYATPQAVIDIFVHDYENFIRGKSVLEPSCGDGRIMLAATRAGANSVFGVEVDPQRASMARQKGLNVLTANFLEVPPEPRFDVVLMNPPFYGKHYAKHVNHALKFLKPDGVLRAILPITAKDHGLVKGRFDDLPIASFRESGTNINTTILTASPGNKAW